ncbi:MAG: hypothetical protein E7553_05105 [Ruminococcaceae bacterium]|nr:hypothetical protein [Oscillospiraceae bacterium]
MMISNQEQLLLLWRYLGYGVWLNLFGIAFDRMRLHFRSGAVRILLDIVGSVAAGFCLFIFSLAAGNGEIRPVMLLAVLIGAGVSHLSFGRLFTLLLDRLNGSIRALNRCSAGVKRKVADFGRKIRKKVELFYKKHLQSNPL